MTFDTQAGTRGARPPSLSGPIGRWVQQLMMRQHRRSWKFQGMDLLFLTTVGRKTGQERVNPVAWFPYGDGTWLIVASAAGSAQNPAWYRNLAAHPDRIRIELRDKTVPVTAEQLSGPAREEARRRCGTRPGSAPNRQPTPRSARSRRRRGTTRAG